MADTEEQKPSGTNSRLYHRLRMGRGGAYHSATIRAIFSKLTQTEADILHELIQHLEADAKRVGASRQRRNPFKRV